MDTALICADCEEPLDGDYAVVTSLEVIDFGREYPVCDTCLLANYTAEKVTLN